MSHTQARLTTALLVGVIPTVVFSVTPPHGANAVSLLALEVVVFAVWRSCVTEAACQRTSITLPWNSLLFRFGFFLVCLHR